VQKNRILTAVLLVVLVFLVLTLVIWKLKKSFVFQEVVPDPAIFGTFIIDKKLPNVFLRCQIQSDEVNQAVDSLGSDLVILRTVPCSYEGNNGEIKSVTVPVAYYNAKLNQFYLLNSEVNDLGKPGSSNLDRMVNLVIAQPVKNPIVSLEANSNPTREDPKLARFIAQTNQGFSQDWAQQFAKTDDNKYLPKTNSGKKIFFALNLTYISE